MPELPEVETMRRGIAGVIGGVIEQVHKVRCRCRPLRIEPRIDLFRRRAVGRRITAVDRCGKRLLVRLDSDETIVIEPRMTGLVLVADPPDQAHMRMWFVLHGSACRRLGYWDRRGLGSIRLLNAAQLESELRSRIGPDALEISVEQLQRRLADRRRAIKPALLDQQLVAGIGNLYASEILHVAGIHPATRCDRLSLRQWAALHRAMNRVLREAIRYEGSTLSDGTYRNALSQNGRYQNHHRVYAREGRPCGRCGAAIRRIVQGQRSTFFCPVCQPKGGR